MRKNYFSVSLSGICSLARFNNETMYNVTKCDFLKSSCFSDVLTLIWVGFLEFRFVVGESTVKLHPCQELIRIMLET